MIGGLLVLVGVVSAALGGDEETIRLVYRAEGLHGKAPTPAEMEATVAVLQKRLEFVEVHGRVSAPKDGGTLTIDVPADRETDIASARRLAERLGTLRFRILASEADEKKWREVDGRSGGASALPPEFQWFDWVEEERGYPVLALTPEEPLRLEIERLLRGGLANDSPEATAARKRYDEVLHDEVFTGDQIGRAAVRENVIQGSVVWFEFKPERKEAFAAFSERHLGQQVAIIVDGKVNAIPFIKSRLPGQGIIERVTRDGFTAREAKELAAVLNSGPMPVGLVRVSAPEKK